MSTVIGSPTDEVLNGTELNDYLDGGLGRDTMIGCSGNDTYVVDNAGDRITEKPNQGYDSILACVSYKMGDNVEAMTLTGTGDINAYGNRKDNVLTGNSGNNIMDGTIGHDTMIGGAGNDTYYVDSIYDRITEQVNEGYDTILTNKSYKMGDSVEAMTLTGTGDINAYGNRKDNVLTGNSGSNRIDGSIGHDTMMGGAGNDTYYLDSIYDKVIEAANEGDDWVISTKTYTLPDNVENLDLSGNSNINGTGNALDNDIVGNEKDNILIGKQGNDWLSGYFGNDTYVLNNGDGSDIISDSDYYDDFSHWSEDNVIQFGSDVEQTSVAFFMNMDAYEAGYNPDWEIGYGSGPNVVTVLNPDTFLYDEGIDRVELSNGNFLTAFDIEQVLTDIMSYATDHSITVNSLSDVQNNDQMMAMINAAWHT